MGALSCVSGSRKGRCPELPFRKDVGEDVVGLPLGWPTAEVYRATARDPGGGEVNCSTAAEAHWAGALWASKRGVRGRPAGPAVARGRRGAKMIYAHDLKGGVEICGTEDGGGSGGMPGGA